MPKCNNMVKINTDYLLLIVAKSGLAQAKFGLYVGQGESLIANALFRGKMKRHVAEFICKQTNSDYSKLVVVDPEPEKAQPLMADDKSIAAIVNALISMDKKIDDIANKVNHVVKELS